jgi:hypothetical protein
MKTVQPLNSAPHGRFRSQPTSLQLPVQLHGQLFRIGSTTIVETKKSRLSRLGIQLPEKKAPSALTGRELRKADELASEFIFFFTPKKSEDPWKGLDSGNAF